MSSEGEKLWASETDPDTNETEVATANPIKIVNRLRITDENGTTYGTISLDANGRFYFDKGIISAEDVVAYGIRSTDVQTVTDLINSIIDAKGTGSGTIDNVEVTGTGNAINSATLSADGKKITLTKGITALTEHQSLDGYATEAWVEGKGYLTTHQNISGKADKNMTMMRRGYIASGDLDSYRDEAGTYGCDLTTVSNKPDGAYNWGDLIVTGWNNYTSSQIYIPDNGSGMYVRTYWDGGWRTWNQVALTKQLSSYLPLAGGTMTGGLSFTYNNTTSLSTLMIAFVPSSTWSDGTNSHPQYGWDMRYHNKGVYSSVLSSYFGMLFHTQLGTLCMTQAGNVGIGTTSPSSKLSVNGVITSSDDVTAFSDVRLKSDIQDLEFRGELHPKSYIKDGRRCIGFLAQEVRGLYPELVHGEEKEDEYLSLNYGAITAVLAAENRCIKMELNEMKERMNRQEDMLNKMMEGK